MVLSDNHNVLMFRFVEASQGTCKAVLSNGDSIIVAQDLKLGLGAVVWDCVSRFAEAARQFYLTTALLQAHMFVSQLGTLPEPFCIAGKHVVELGSGTGTCLRWVSHFELQPRMCELAQALWASLLLPAAQAVSP